jgi:DNA repair exonuclease SbcCD ATPase subunit
MKAVFYRLRTISLLQTKIRDLRNRIAILQELLVRQESDREYLAILCMMPVAYAATLEEVARRRTFGRALLDEIHRISANFARLRAEERARRDKYNHNPLFHRIPSVCRISPPGRFMSTYGRYVIQQLFPGLDEAPPAVEVSCAPFDTQLPMIEGAADRIDLSRSLSESDHRARALEEENARLQADIRNLKQEVERLRKELEAARAAPAAEPAEAPRSADLLSRVEQYKERIKVLCTSPSDVCVYLPHLADPCTRCSNWKRLCTIRASSSMLPSAPATEYAPSISLYLFSVLNPSLFLSV